MFTVNRFAFKRDLSFVMGLQSVGVMFYAMYYMFFAPTTTSALFSATYAGVNGLGLCVTVLAAFAAGVLIGKGFHYAEIASGEPQQ